MTLSPVFRSNAAIEVLRSEGVWDRLDGASVAQRDAILRVRADMLHVIDARYLRDARGDAGGEGAVPLDFVQEFFFLIFFRSVLESVGIRRKALDLYSFDSFAKAASVTAFSSPFIRCSSAAIRFARRRSI